MKHIGNLEIRTAADAKKYAGLTEVTGDLYIYSSAKLDALTSVGGDLSINSTWLRQQQAKSKKPSMWDQSIACSEHRIDSLELKLSSLVGETSQLEAAE